MYIVTLGKQIRTTKKLTTAYIWARKHLKSEISNIDELYVAVRQLYYGCMIMEIGDTNRIKTEFYQIRRVNEK